MSIHDKELRQVYTETLIELAGSDPRIMVLEADLMRASGTFPFKERFPERTVDLGVAEQNMIAFAAGLAAEGKIPFAASFTSFATRRALDQFTVSAAYTGLPVKLVGTAPGITAELNGGTHMCFTDLARMRALPGVMVLAPCDAADMRAAIITAVDYPGPVYLQMLRGKMPRVFDPGRHVLTGQADVMREGRDATIVACGFTTPLVLEAANLLEDQNIRVEVLNMTVVKPLDQHTLVRSAQKTGQVITVENGSVIGGLGSAVTEALSDLYPVPVKRLGVQDEWGEVGRLDYLAQRFRLTPHQLAADIAAFVRRQSAPDIRQGEIRDASA